MWHVPYILFWTRNVLTRDNVQNILTNVGSHTPLSFEMNVNESSAHGISDKFGYGCSINNCEN